MLASPFTRHVVPSPKYFVGLDLGQAADFSAMAVVERVGERAKTVSTNGSWPPIEQHHYVRFLHRWPLKTSYVRIVEDLGVWWERRTKKGGTLAGATLAVDATGVGKAVFDMVREARLQAILKGVVITGGHNVSIDQAGIYHIPKKDLVGVMQSVIQPEPPLLHPPKESEVPIAKIFREELYNFRTKQTAAGNHQFEVEWREGQNDDLVLAAALAVWMGEREIGQTVTASPFVVARPGLQFGNPNGAAANSQSRFSNPGTAAR